VAVGIGSCVAAETVGSSVGACVSVGRLVGDIFSEAEVADAEAGQPALEQVAVGMGVKSEAFMVAMRESSSSPDMPASCSTASRMALLSGCSGVGCTSAR
jgi:hypothetical protein